MLGVSCVVYAIGLLIGEIYICDARQTCTAAAVSVAEVDKNGRFQNVDIFNAEKIVVLVRG